MTKRDYFEGKRIAVIGIGPNAEMISDIKYLIKSGALVGLYDLRSEARLKSHLVFLRSIGLANYVCGSIPEADLVDMDMIILSQEYPRDSLFLRQAEEKKIPIEYPETLFFKQAPPVTLVGIMGACGKSTVVSMLYPMLETVCKEIDNQGFYLIDSETGGGIISHLRRIKNGDIVLMKIEEKMMKELKSLRISPQVAVFTSLPQKQFYDISPFEILSYQTYNNFIIASDEIIDAIRLYKFQPKAKMLRTKISIVPSDLDVTWKGQHDKENAALAWQTSTLFKVDEEIARKALTEWKPLKGRLEFVKKVKNVEYYNDSYSISPYSVIAGIASLSVDRNLILIFGGADRGLEYTEFYSMMPQFIKILIMIPGSGTLKERRSLRDLEKIEIISVPSLDEAVRVASERSQKGDRVLFSPGFEAAGYDRSRKERGERFVRAVRGL